MSNSSGISSCHVNGRARTECFSRLTDERDSLAAQCIQLTLDKMTLKDKEIQPPPSPVVKENSGLTLELADTKSRLRRLQHDYEEKIEILSEAKEECEQLKENLQRLRQVSTTFQGRRQGKIPSSFVRVNGRDRRNSEDTSDSCGSFSEFR